MDGVVVDVERRRYRARDALRGPRRVRSLGDAVEQDRELVAAEPRREVDLAQASLEPLSERDKQLIAGEVAERVVHVLESIEVEQHDREAGPRSPSRACD